MDGCKIDWPGHICAKFLGRRGKVLHWLFSIVGMAYQSQNGNKAITDDRVARSRCKIDGVGDIPVVNPIGECKIDGVRDIPISNPIGE